MGWPSADQAVKVPVTATASAFGAQRRKAVPSWCGIEPSPGLGASCWDMRTPVRSVVAARRIPGWRGPPVVVPVPVDQPVLPPGGSTGSGGAGAACRRSEHAPPRRSAQVAGDVGDEVDGAAGVVDDGDGAGAGESADQEVGDGLAGGEVGGGGAGAAGGVDAEEPALLRFGGGEVESGGGGSGGGRGAGGAGDLDGQGRAGLDCRAGGVGGGAGPGVDQPGRRGGCPLVGGAAGGEVAGDVGDEVD